MIRRGSAAVFVPLVAFLYGFAYYGTRSMLAMRAMDEGVDYDGVHAAMLAISGAGVLGAFVAAALGALLGPSGTAAVGLGIAGLACLVPPTSAASLLLLGGTLGFGAGLYRPALYAAAARPWTRAEGAGIAFVLVLAWVGLNGAAAAAGPAAGWLRGVSPGALGPVGAALFFVAAALLAADAGVQWLAPAEPTSAAPPAWDPRAIGIGLAVALALAGVQALWTLASNGQYSSIGPVLQASPWVEYLNPLTVIVVGLLLAVVLVVAALIQARVPVLLVSGAGVALLGLSFVVSAAGAWLPASVALVGAVLVLGAAAEVVALPVAFAAAARGVHWRLSTAVVAIQSAAAGVVGLISNALPPFAWFAVLAGLMLVAVGVAMAAAAIPLDRWLLAEEPTPPA